MSGEELKAQVRVYADEHFGRGWDVASVMVTHTMSGQAETLIVLRDVPENGKGPRVREAPQQLHEPSLN